MKRKLIIKDVSILFTLKRNTTIYRIHYTKMYEACEVAVSSSLQKIQTSDVTGTRNHFFGGEAKKTLSRNFCEKQK